MLTIIVPYRDREEHLRQFIPHMNNYLPDAKIFIVEQAKGEPFNRGRLLNIGFLEAPKSEYYVFHDVDMMPIDCSYKGGFAVIQLANSKIQTKDYLGGVTMFERKIFTAVGGYHNDFFHRAEDNEMMFHLKRRKVPVVNRFGTFRPLQHLRSGPEFIPELWEKAQLPRTINMLEKCTYDMINKQIHETNTHIKVIL